MCTHSPASTPRCAQKRAMAVSWLPNRLCRNPRMPCHSVRLPCSSTAHALASYHGRVPCAGTIVSWPCVATQPCLKLSHGHNTQQCIATQKSQQVDSLMSRYNKLYRDLHSLPIQPPSLSQYSRCIATQFSSAFKSASVTIQSVYCNTLCPAASPSQVTIHLLYCDPFPLQASLLYCNTKPSCNTISAHPICLSCNTMPNVTIYFQPSPRPN